MPDGSNILKYVPWALGLLVVIALYLGGKKFLEQSGLAFWEGVWRVITWPFRRIFRREAPQVAQPQPEPPEVNQHPAQPQTVEVVVRHEQIPPASPQKSTAPQLPDPVTDFRGRESKVEQVVKRLRNREGAVIGGQGGVGKTELAYYVASEVRDVYPGGQIQLNLRGLDKDPVTPEKAMGEVILALEPGQKLPEPGQIAGLYQGLLAERSVLILADNAKDSDQVRPLVPKPPSALLVTSRQTILLAGIERVDLEQLDPPEAAALLRGILGEKPASGEQIAELAGLCGYLPLALRVVGNRLAASPALGVGDYLKKLAEKPADMRFEGRDVMKVLAESVEALERDDADLVKKWRSLAVFPAPFDRQAAEAVGEFEGDELDVLVGRSLVLYDKKEERLRLHDLMSEVARISRPASEMYGAAGRHAAHYQAVAGRADDTYESGGDGVLEGLRLFDRNRVHIEAGQAWAAEHAASDEAAALLAQLYPLRAPNMLELRQHPRERIRWMEASAQAARKLGNRKDEGLALGNLGNAYADLGETRRAIEYYEQVLAIAREAGDRRTEGNALGNLGAAYADLGETRRAIEYNEQRLTIARETGDRRGEGRALGNLGVAYRRLGETRRSIEYYEQRLAIARETGDRRGEGMALNNLGVAYQELGETRRAIEHYEQDLAIARETGDRRGEGQTLGNLGNAYADLGETRRAIEYYEQHQAMARETGDRRGEGNALWNRALAVDSLCRREEAIADAKASLTIREQIEDPNADKARRQLADWGVQSEG